MSHWTPRVVKGMLKPFDSGNLHGAFARLKKLRCFEPTKTTLLCRQSRVNILGKPFLIQEEHEICLLLLYKQAL